MMMRNKEIRMEKEIKRELRKLEQMLEVNYEEVEEQLPTTLDKKILKQYEIIWQDVLKICKSEKIKDMNKFDEIYSIFENGLEKFINDYVNILDYCTQMDLKFIEIEVKMLKQVMEQFKLGEDKKQKYELLIIRNTLYKNRFL